jgi:hypothetical protein
MRIFFELTPALAGGLRIEIEKGFSQTITVWLKPFLCSIIFSIQLKLDAINLKALRLCAFATLKLSANPLKSVKTVAKNLRILASQHLSTFKKLLFLVINNKINHNEIQA